MNDYTINKVSETCTILVFKHEELKYLAEVSGNKLTLYRCWFKTKEVKYSDGTYYYPVKPSILECSKLYEEERPSMLQWAETCIEHYLKEQKYISFVWVEVIKQR